MNNLNITPEEFKKITSSMDLKTKKLFEKMYVKNVTHEFISYIQEWIDQLNPTDPIDNLLLIIVSKSILNIGASLAQNIESAKMKEQQIYRNSDLAKKAIYELRKIADELELNLPAE